MSSEIILDVKNVSKCYNLYSRPRDRLFQIIFGGEEKYARKFWALRDITFSVNKGACIGIIGRNGAGKSTLLQVISGIVSPTSGELSVKGKVAALLELGTGFNPEFTGKENVFLNGAILGLTQQEITNRYEEIVAFADIGDFISQPVKTYSSGMLVRLAFAVAIHVDPDILIVDEALSVGDAKFQAKCFRKFQEFRDGGKTILFVTHATEQVIRHCDYALLVENGEIIDRGDPKKVAHRYLTLLFDTNPIEKTETARNDNMHDNPTLNQENQTKDPSQPSTNELNSFLNNTDQNDKLALCPGYNNAEYRWGDGSARIIDCLICNQQHWHLNHFKSQDSITVYVKVSFERDVARPIYGLTLKTPDGVTVFGTNSRDIDIRGKFMPQKSGSTNVVSFSFSPRLTAGHYFLSLGVVEDSDSDVTPLDRRYDVIEIYITNEQRIYGIADLEMTFSEVR